MKISKSKQELARIISENGGWRDGCDFVAQDKDSFVCFYEGKPTRCGDSWEDKGDCQYRYGRNQDGKIQNWHQTILSRDEYFHLYQVAETAPEQVAEAKPTIEQLAADYRNAKDCAERKQQEADDAKYDADEALRKLELAGEDIGLIVTPISAKQEPELVITDWLDLRAGDVISVSGKWWEPDSEYTVDENDGSRDAPIRVGGYWAIIGECSFKFIRHP